MQGTKSSKKLAVIGALAWLACLGCAANAAPPAYGPRATPFIAISPDGEYIGYLNQVGDLRVLSLATKRQVFSPSDRKVKSFELGQGYEFLAFRGSLHEILWDCRDGAVCSSDLGEGKPRTLFEHDPSDNVLVGIASDDGSRGIFGTRHGRVFSVDFTSGVHRTYKAKDTWTQGGADVIYTLEGRPDLDYFLSATSGITQAVAYENDPATRIFRESGHMEVRHYDGSYFTDVLYRGINLWRWDETEPTRIDDGFSDKVRADFSPDGSLLVINQEGGPPYNVYKMPGVDLTAELGLVDRFHCNGVRFLDLHGRYLGVTSFWGKKLSVTDLVTKSEGKPRVHEIKLRNKPAGGRRMMVAHPEKGWVFIGLAKGGVDWYQFSTDPTPSLEHIATLK